MRAVIHFREEWAHQRDHALAMRSGLERHGIAVAFGHYDAPTLRDPDFAVVWGAPSKQPAVAASVPHVLVMERGHVGDRMQIASCGWDGLGRRGRYPVARDGGYRWGRLFGDLMRPWSIRDGYALIIGQVENDAALRGLVMRDWVEQVTAELHAKGWATCFRPHPTAVRPVRSLADDLAGAGLCVSYNSTAGVEAVLAGVPTVTMDEGAMAWPVTGHAIGDALRPNRDRWAHDLAFTGWTLEEIVAGDAWECLAPIMEEAPCAIA